MKSILLSLCLVGCATKNPASDETTGLDLNSQEMSRQATPKKGATPIQAVIHDPAPEGVDKAALYGEAPEHAQALLPLLSAHHVEDLPTQDTLAAHPQAEDALRWIAQSEYNFGVRSRAIFMLHLYESSETLALLTQLASDTEGPHGLRASAFESMGKWSLAKRESLKMVISAGLDDAHPLVVVAAIHASQGIESLESKVADLQRNHPSPLVQKTGQNQ